MKKFLKKMLSQRSVQLGMVCSGLVFAFLTFFYFWITSSHRQISFYTHPELSPFLSKYSDPETQNGTPVYLLSEASEPVALIEGPRKLLPAGKYRVLFHLNVRSETEQTDQAQLTITGNGGSTIFGQKSLSLINYSPGEYQEEVYITLEQEVSDIETKVETNTTTLGARRVDIVATEVENWPVYEFIDWRVMSFSVIALIGFTVFLACIPRIKDQKVMYLLLIILPLSCSFFWPKHLITGDEPHYLVTTKNLVLNKTLNMEQAYSAEIKNEFVSAELKPHMHESVKTGEQYAHHGYFTSLLLIPGYLAAGEAGVKFELGLFAAISVLLTYLICKQLGSSSRVAAAVSFGLLLTPFSYFTYAIYPEIIAAVFLLFAVFAALKKSTTFQYLAMFGLGITVLLNSKYMLPVCFAAGFILFNTHQKKLPKVILAVILLLAFTVYFLLNWQLFGSLNPVSYYSGGQGLAQHSIGTIKVKEAVVTGLAQLFDSRAGLLVWIPASVLALFGVLRFLTSSEIAQRKAGWVLTLTITSYMAIYSYSGSLGGDSPALRPWIAVLPLVAILVAEGVKALRHSFLALGFLLPTLYLVIGSTLYGVSVTNVYTDPINRFFVMSGGQFNNLGIFLPQLTDRQTLDLQDLFGIFWIVGALLASYLIVVNTQQILHTKSLYQAKLLHKNAPTPQQKKK